jgi:cobalt-zinc-cadmium efflux system outer membrane protein
MVGCSSAPQENGLESLQEIVQQRADYPVLWDQNDSSTNQIKTALDILLSGELTPDAAVRVALLCNPSLQATYAQLGVSRSDVLEAGLLRNPVLSARVRFPDGSASGTHYEFDLVTDFLDLLLISTKKHLAEAQYEQAEQTVAHEVLDLASQVQQAYYRAVAAQHLAANREQAALASRASFEFATRLHNAGNIDDLALANEQTMYDQSLVDQSLSLAEIQASREEFIRLLGLSDRIDKIQLPTRLPELPTDEINTFAITELALEQRFDLSAARRRVDLLDQALKIKRDNRWLNNAEIGVNTEHDIDGLWLTGPTASIELPLFNQHQADIVRLEAQKNQAEHNLRAMENDTRSWVRLLADKLIRTRQLTEHYSDQVIPLRRRIVDLVQRKYNYMLAGVFELILAKQNEYEAERASVEALRDYWLTRTQLQQAVGGKLPTNTQGPQLKTPILWKSATQPATQPSSQPSTQPATQPADSPSTFGQHDRTDPAVPSAPHDHYHGGH